jgi:type I restriction enzyme S subunit
MEGWELRPLGDVCQVVNGGTPRTGVTDYWDGSHAWITPAEMGKAPSALVSSTERTLSDTGLANSSAKLIPPNSVILSTRAPIGHLVINEVPMAFNQGCRGLVPGDLLTTKYLYYFLLHSTPVLEGLGTGATFKELSAGKLKGVQIPLPPLGEQERIVRILDDTITNVERARELVVDGSRKVQGLLDEFLDSTITSLSDRWPVSSLGELADFRNGVNYTKSSRGPVVSVIGVKDFQDHFYAPRNGLARVQLDSPLDPQDGVKSGDLLIVRSNGNPNLIGRCMVVADMDDQVAYSGFTIRTRLRDSESLMPTWVAWVLRSRSTRRLMVDQGTGTNIRSLNQGVLASIPMPLPPRHEQEIITDTLTKVNARARQLGQSFAARLCALDQLRASLLHQAFTGQL